MIKKVQPIAKPYVDYGMDGRAGATYCIQYYCPNPICKKEIHEKDIACTNCGTFFDWSKKAYAKVVLVAEWK